MVFFQEQLPEMKKCKRCETTRPVEMYRTIQNKYVSNICIPCANNKMKEYYQKNKEKIKKYQKEYQKKRTAAAKALKESQKESSDCGETNANE